jgi:predicted transcriptional regulator
MYSFRATIRADIIMSPNSDLDILASDLMHIGLIMVEKNESLYRVVQLMSAKKIATVVVEDSVTLKYYIIAHSDIIDFLSKNKDNTLDLNQHKAAELMHPIDVILKDTPLDIIIQLMLTQGFKRVIVVNEKAQPLGIISQADILAWNNRFFQQGHPILLCVLENETGIILAQKFFKEDMDEAFLDLFGGSLTAISSLTSEVLKRSGNLRVIEKDYYAIMLEPRDQVTGVLVVDHQSLDLRRKLQIFIDSFIDDHRDELDCRKILPGPINIFKIRHVSEIFKE